MRRSALTAVILVLLAVGCLDAPGPTTGDTGDDAAATSDDDAAAGADDGATGDLMNGLIAWYAMDELIAGDGNSANAPDSIGGIDGSCIAPACPEVVSGHIGNAYLFDGGDDEVLAPDRVSLHTASGTVAVWFFQNGGGRMLISKPLGNQTEDSWLLFADSDGSILFETAGDVRTISATGLVGLEEWIHVAMTWGPDGNLLYIGGEQVKAGGVGTSFDSNKVVLGADHDLGELILPMNGRLDDVRIYDRVLSPDEMAALAGM